MSTNMPRISLAIPEGLLEKIDNYRYTYRIRNQSQTIIQLIRLGLNAVQNVDNEPTIGARIAGWLSPLSIEEQAELLNVSEYDVNRIVNDDMEPTQAQISAVAKKFGIPKERLIYGAQFSVYSEQEEELLTNYKKMDEYGKKAVQAVMQVELDRITPISASLAPPSASPASTSPALRGKVKKGF